MESVHYLINYQTYVQKTIDLYWSTYIKVLSTLFYTDIISFACKTQNEIFANYTKQFYNSNSKEKGYNNS